jgi:peptidoglycan/LPS O-acetylase OafA/YrhL
MTVGASAGPTVETGGRDRFIDFVRAFSLLVVVVWHWVFTILIWRDDGPHATSPIGFFDGLFLATWLLQVMPLFFFVGGFAHRAAWLSASRKGVRIWSFVGRRVTELAIPALALVAVWGALGIAVIWVFDAAWMGRAVLLVISPLWFLAVYLLLILLLPLTLRLHDRFDVLVPVFLVGLAGLVDVLRFRYEVSHIAWANMVLVWGLCHQLGFFYRRMVDAGRRVHWAFAWGGLFALIGLVATGFYPGSMVGVPGDEFSNMAPPTLPIVALVFFQAGAALLLRPWVLERLEMSERWAAASVTMNRFALPLYLFHSTGLAVSRGLWHWVRGGQEQRDPDLVWWLTRPFAFLGALVLTLPVIYLFGRRWVKPEPVAGATSPTPSLR